MVNARDAADDGRTIRSLDRAVALLDATRRLDGAGVTALAEELDLSKSTVHQYLVTLRKHGFVEKEGSTYRLGLGLLPFAGYAREQVSVFDIGQDMLDLLARETGETSRLIVERRGQGITLYQSVSEEGAQPPTHVGKREDLHCTAAGKAFLAELPDEEVADIFDRRGLERYTENTVTDRNALFEEIETIRSRGFATADRERYPDTDCIATSVRSEEGQVMGAISVLVPAAEMDDKRHGELAEPLQNIAGAIEINTTYADWE
jgi:DNA-binding IclR family transcriptional regulator